MGTEESKKRERSNRSWPRGGHHRKQYKRCSKARIARNDLSVKKERDQNNNTGKGKSIGRKEREGTLPGKWERKVLTARKGWIRSQME